MRRPLSSLPLQEFVPLGKGVRNQSIFQYSQNPFHFLSTLQLNDTRHKKTLPVRSV